MHTVKRYHDFSAGHVVTGHESKCAHLHGHNYRVTFMVAKAPQMIDARTFDDDMPRTVPGAGGLDDVGRVVDFSVIKTHLCQWLEDNWDHKFMVWDRDPRCNYLLDLDPRGVVLTPFNPTAENMAEYLVRVVGPRQLAGLGVQLIACEVQETRKCSASFIQTRAS